jgi:hypothetical protein
MSAKKLAEKPPEIGSAAPTWERWRLAGVFAAKPFPIHSPPGRQRSQGATDKRWHFDCLLKDFNKADFLPCFPQNGSQIMAPVFSLFCHHNLEASQNARNA